METDSLGGLPATSLSNDMVVLKAFADAHPHSFEFIQPEDFVHFENEAFTGIEEWDSLLITVSPAMPVRNSEARQEALHKGPT